MICWAYLFIKRPTLVSLIMFKHVQVGKHTEYMRQKLSKNMFIVKIQPCIYASFFFYFIFIPGWNFTGMILYPDKVWSRWKGVNNKKHRYHFTIDKDDFISKQDSFRNEILPLNTLHNSRFLTTKYLVETGTIVLIFIVSRDRDMDIYWRSITKVFWIVMHEKLEKNIRIRGLTTQRPVFSLQNYIFAPWELNAGLFLTAWQFF